MGKGIKQRHRLKNQLKSQAIKKNKLSILDNHAQKQQLKKQKRSPDDLPASLRKLIALKAAAENGGGKNRYKQQHTNTAASPTKPRQDGSRESLDGDNLLETADVPANKDNDKTKITENRRDNARNSKNDETSKASKASGAAKGLKPKKKEFLKQKKLKKKMKSSGVSNDMTEKEEEFQERAAISKPSFGEQAHQPISVNLKRRHWKDQEKTAADRCKAVFMKQMTNAARQSGMEVPTFSKKRDLESSRLQVIDAYRKSKRQDGEAPPLATMGSLAALVQRQNG